MQTGEVVRHRQPVQLASVVGKARGGEADGDEDRHLHDVRLFVPPAERVRIGQVVQHDRRLR